mmetsp:Transcript_26314/g.78141  ORF Transcript_26314/g.78141 Transcript_26314/m.78141 type:complete len:254 (-) Transcript_26314:1156-1917(-)
MSLRTQTPSWLCSDMRHARTMVHLPLQGCWPERHLTTLAEVPARRHPRQQSPSHPGRLLKTAAARAESQHRHRQRRNRGAHAVTAMASANHGPKTRTVAAAGIAQRRMTASWRHLRRLLHQRHATTERPPCMQKLAARNRHAKVRQSWHRQLPVVRRPQGQLAAPALALLVGRDQATHHLVLLLRLLLRCFPRGRRWMMMRLRWCMSVRLWRSAVRQRTSKACWCVTFSRPNRSSRRSVRRARRAARRAPALC